MNKREIQKFRNELSNMAKRIQGTAESAEEQARTAIGGEAGGDLSNVPMHLGDIGTAAFTQELGATLLENEQYLQGEIVTALDRIEKGTYGKCENCGKPINKERLEAIPYARHCVACANILQAAPAVNINAGRPSNWVLGIGLSSEGAELGVSGDRKAQAAGDIHAAGTPGGGTAVGGLGGTNLGRGEPTHADLEEAMGSGNFDVEIASEDNDEEDELQTEEPDGFAGRSGGAVGGTPANKRSRGGKAHRE
jgi:RNA polymerase-binding transcription factor DksA